MKRVYIKPAMKNHDVEMDLMIATSGVPNLNIMNDGETISSESEMLGREDNSISGSSLWDQGW